MSYSCKKSISRKKPVLPIEEFLSPLLTSNMITFFLSITCQVLTYGRFKTKENFKLLALKVVVVTCGGWSLTRGSKDYSGKTGLLQEVVTTGGATVFD